MKYFLIGFLMACMFIGFFVCVAFGEVPVLASVIASEAVGEGKVGLHAVTNVIANRSKAWNKTPLEVVTQKNQFYGYTAKNRVRLYKECGKVCDDLARDIMTLPDITKGALYFRQPNEKRMSWHGVETFRYKNHIFYKENAK